VKENEKKIKKRCLVFGINRYLLFYVPFCRSLLNNNNYCCCLLLYF
jgi:hypothetical protein